MVCLGSFLDLSWIQSLREASISLCYPLYAINQWAKRLINLSVFSLSMIETDNGSFLSWFKLKLDGIKKLLICFFEKVKLPCWLWFVISVDENSSGRKKRFHARTVGRRWFNSTLIAEDAGRFSKLKSMKSCCSCASIYLIAEVEGRFIH